MIAARKTSNILKVQKKCVACSIPVFVCHAPSRTPASLVMTLFKVVFHGHRMKLPYTMKCF
jgi:hypothetical protein